MRSAPPEDLASAQPAHFFDSEAVERLIADFQKTGRTETLAQVIEACRPISESVVRQHRSFIYEEEQEIYSVVNRKLLLALPEFDRSRGSAFSYVSKVCVNMIRTRVSWNRKQAARYQPLDQTLIATMPAPTNFQARIDDTTQQIRRSIRSTITDEKERECQRWFPASFCDAYFQMRRHQYSNAAMAFFSLTHKRSRQLHDLSLLEALRTVYGEIAHPPVNMIQLGRSRNAALLRFANFCTPQEFVKLVALLHGLPASIIALQRPCNESRIRAGDWQSVRQNLLLILEGDPRATPLF